MTARRTISPRRGVVSIENSNPQSEEARYLVALTPSGYEFYFERLARLIRTHGTMPSQEALARLMAEHGTFLATI